MSHSFYAVVCYLAGNVDFGYILHVAAHCHAIIWNCNHLYPVVEHGHVSCLPRAALHAPSTLRS